MLQYLGMLGGILFALSALPVGFTTLKNGHARGIPRATTWCVVLGAWSCVAYLLLSANYDAGLLTSYAPAGVCWAIALWYSYFPRGAKRP